MVALSTFVLFGVVGPAFIWQRYLNPLLRAGGVFRKVEPLNNGNCQTIQELEGCEKMVLDHTTNLLYLACSRVSARPYWLSSVGNLNSSGKATDDYIGVYDIATSKITRLDVAPYPNSDRGLSLHGMDVVRSSLDSTELFFYVVNHRVPLVGRAEEVGADSSIEVFSLRDGSTVLQHVATFEDPIISTPNDVTGTSDGKSFWFTNDHISKTGFIRHLELPLDLYSTTVGYCHLENGCKIAAPKLPGANGIVKSPHNETIYVASAQSTGIRAFERQSDNTLQLLDFITTDYVPVDNLSIDSNGALWGAGFPQGIALLRRIRDLTTNVPSRAIRITSTTETSERKYNSQKVFEDDGLIINGATSVVYHVPTKQLFLNGILAPAMAVCKV